MPKRKTQACPTTATRKELELLYRNLHRGCNRMKCPSGEIGSLISRSTEMHERVHHMCDSIVLPGIERGEDLEALVMNIALTALCDGIVIGTWLREPAKMPVRNSFKRKQEKAAK